MKVVFAGSALAATVILGSAAFAQSTATPPAQQPPAATATTQRESPAEQVTLVGCVQREEDYRKAHNLGQGGTVGTGAGVANEFVLVAAMKGPAGSAATTTGTSGTTATGDAYELSGEKESELKAFVGKRVEIMGKMKAAEKSATGATTGGVTAGTPPTGIDVTSKDLKLREVDIVSVKEATGTCPASPMK